MKGLYRGLQRASNRFDVSIVGGETSSTSGPIAVSIAAAGFVEKERWVSRRGGQPDDDLFVTGRLGGALKQRHLRFVPRIVESRWARKDYSVPPLMDLVEGLA